jgi:hypothetical protein
VVVLVRVKVYYKKIIEEGGTRSFQMRRGKVSSQTSSSIQALGRRDWVAVRKEGRMQRKEEEKEARSRKGGVNRDEQRMHSRGSKYE